MKERKSIKMLRIDVDVQIEELKELIEIKRQLLIEKCEKDCDDDIIALSNEIYRLQEHIHDLRIVSQTLKGKGY